MWSLEVILPSSHFQISPGNSIGVMKHCPTEVIVGATSTDILKKAKTDKMISSFLFNPIDIQNLTSTLNQYKNVINEVLHILSFHTKSSKIQGKFYT